MGSRFEKLAFMKEKRFGHMGIYHHQENSSYVYVFGGKTESDQIIHTCERYCLTQSNNRSILEKWSNIAPMNLPRCFGQALIFQQKFYIFGGFSGKNKSSKKIDVYDPLTNKWILLQVILFINKG